MQRRNSEIDELLAGCFAQTSSASFALFDNFVRILRKTISEKQIELLVVLNFHIYHPTASVSLGFEFSEGLDAISAAESDLTG